MAIQVKTASGAKKKKYGKLGYEWHVGRSVINKHSESFIYTLLDFKGDLTRQPDVFFTPSRWVAEFVKPNWKM